MATLLAGRQGQHRWVGYLEKSGNTFTAYVKKPGEADWVPIMSQAGMKVLTVKPHAGMGTEQVQEFYPCTALCQDIPPVKKKPRICEASFTM